MCHQAIAFLTLSDNLVSPLITSDKRSFVFELESFRFWLGITSVAVYDDLFVGGETGNIWRITLSDFSKTNFGSQIGCIERILCTTSKLITLTSLAKVSYFKLFVKMDIIYRIVFCRIATGITITLSSASAIGVAFSWYLVIPISKSWIKINFTLLTHRCSQWQWNHWIKLIKLSLKNNDKI